MLESQTERLLEVAQHVQSRVRILYVIVRQLLSLDLPGEGQGERLGLEGGIEGRLLMRILAVAQALLEIELQEEFLRKACFRTHVGGDAAVILRRMGIGLGGKLQPGGIRSPALGAKFGKHGVVIGRIAYDGDILPVLGGAAHHGRPADVDVLNGFFEGDTLLRDGLAERIEVHAHEVDGLNSILLKCLHVRGKVPACQDSAVHLRVQSLHPAVQDLGETRNFADAYGPDALALEELLRAPGGDYLPTEIYKALHEGNQARLIADAYQCSHFKSFAIVST